MILSNILIVGGFMNRIEIKEKAKVLVKENFKNFWKGYLTILAISLLCNFTIELLLDNGSTLYNCLTLVVSFFTSTLSVGFTYYVLKMTRGEEVEREDLFKFVGNILPITVISVLMMVFVLLGAVLFIIPGIIIALSYAMVFYLYAENQEHTPMDYLSQSKELMKGYKWDYFVFELSFLGWILFGIVTFGIGLIWVIPYVTIAQTIYYTELKVLKKRS